jgi:hypothetical protein
METSVTLDSMNTENWIRILMGAMMAALTLYAMWE